jgi:hypothetical protein
LKARSSVYVVQAFRPAATADLKVCSTPDRNPLTDLYSSVAATLPE